MIESQYLKDNMKNIQKLMEIPALRNFETKNLGKLLRLSKIRRYEKGEQIIEEGGMDKWLYFLLSGKIRIEKEGMEIGTIDKMGEMFGEMRLIDSLSRSASVYAADKSICLAVDTAASGNRDFKDERLDFLFFMYRIFAEFASYRLRLTNEELIKARKEIESLRPAPG